MNRRLLILLTTVSFLSCSTMYDAKGVPKGNPCAKFIPFSTSNRPIICVDDRNLSRITTSPNTVWARRKAPIKWYTVTGAGGLTISFDNEECVTKASLDSCRGGSSCEATLSGKGKEGTKCKYSVTLTRNNEMFTEDPIIIIDGGMHDPDAPDEKPPEP